MEPFDDEIRRAAVLRSRPEPPCLEPEELEAFYAGRLSEPRVGEIRNHLASCARCLETARELCLFLGAKPPAESVLSLPQPDFVRRSALPLAAALIVAVSAGIVWRIQRTGHETALTRGVARDLTVEVAGPEGELDERPRALEWRPTAFADHYEVEIRDVRLNVLWRQSGLREARAAIPVDLALARGVEYAWRVTAVKPDGGRVTSGFATFRIVVR